MQSPPLQVVLRWFQASGLVALLILSGCMESPGEPRHAGAEPLQCEAPRPEAIATAEDVFVRADDAFDLVIGQAGSGWLRLVPCGSFNLRIELQGVPLDGSIGRDGVVAAYVRNASAAGPTISDTRTFWGAPQPYREPPLGGSAGTGAEAGGVQPWKVEASEPMVLVLATTLPELRFRIGPTEAHADAAEIPWNLTADPGVEEFEVAEGAPSDEMRVPPDTRRIAFHEEREFDAPGYLVMRGWRAYEFPDTQAGLYSDYLSIGNQAWDDAGEHVPRGGTAGSTYGHFIEGYASLEAPQTLALTRHYYETMAGVPTAEIATAVLWVPDPVAR